MEDSILNDLLENYEDEDYVYIIEGCMNWYASLNPCQYYVCPICESMEYEITSGYVKDLKKLKTMEDIDDYNEHKIEEKKSKKLIKKINL